jgi:alkanesulfonate monooxygenase SsuD/methylene tetrahydromethanopterin reductase-like flavin-dependent oxidoreductase (luciferase family)
MAFGRRRSLNQKERDPIMHVHIGINVNTRVPVLYPETYPERELLALAETVEAEGYDSVWVGDSMFQKSRLEALITLAAIAARTQRVLLGTAAVIAPLRNATWLALSWATLDRLAAGRTILGLCVGAERHQPGVTGEFEAAGANLRTRGQVFTEQLEIIRHLWSTERFDYDGTHHTLHGVQSELRPMQRPAPPIWIASNPHVGNLSPRLRARMAQRVVAHADGWMTCTASPEEYHACWTELQEQASAAGRNPATIVPAYQLLCHIDNDRAKARAIGVEFVNGYYHSAYNSLNESRWGEDPYGTADDCVAAMRALADAGCEHFVVRFAAPDQHEQLRRFTADVLPAFR